MAGLPLSSQVGHLMEDKGGWKENKMAKKEAKVSLQEEYDGEEEGCYPCSTPLQDEEKKVRKSWSTKENINPRKITEAWQNWGNKRSG